MIRCGELRDTVGGLVIWCIVCCLGCCEMASGEDVVVSCADLSGSGPDGDCACLRAGCVCAVPPVGKVFIDASTTSIVELSIGPCVASSAPNLGGVRWEVFFGDEIVGGWFGPTFSFNPCIYRWSTDRDVFDVKASIDVDGPCCDGSGDACIVALGAWSIELLGLCRGQQ